MADLSSTPIDAEVPESGSFTCLPEGNYPVVIIHDEIKNTQKGGKMLEIKLLIFEGKYKGENLTDRLNLINSSSIAQKIGQGTLKKLCRLTGLTFPPKNTEGWKGKPLTVKVGVTEFTSNTSGKTLKGNEIKDYKEYQKQEQVTNTQTPSLTGGSW
jgi:hypothetical protein